MHSNDTSKLLARFPTGDEKDRTWRTGKIRSLECVVTLSYLQCWSSYVNRIIALSTLPIRRCSCSVRYLSGSTDRCLTILGDGLVAGSLLWVVN